MFHKHTKEVSLRAEASFENFRVSRRNVFISFHEEKCSYQINGLKKKSNINYRDDVMITADEKVLSRNGGRSLFSQENKRKTDLNSLHFITQAEIEDVIL